ncbi:MAG: GntR family transcriptional regulator [Sulfitobacter sp.]
MQSFSHIISPAPGTSETSATHRTYLAIQNLIVTGALKPGEKLKIEGLRGRLDTGASPIREALSLLTSDNLVERIDQRGFRVAPTSQSNFEEILELRCDLEERALRKSIANRCVDWEEYVVLCHHRMTRGKQTDDPAFEALHKAFHMALLSRCGAPILMKFCSQLYDLNIRYRYLAGSALNYTKRDVSFEHEAIMQAAIAGQADKATELLLTHYRQTGAFLVGALSAGEQG